VSLFFRKFLKKIFLSYIVSQFFYLSKKISYLEVGKKLSIHIHTKDLSESMMLF